MRCERGRCCCCLLCYLLWLLQLRSLGGRLVLPLETRSGLTERAFLPPGVQLVFRCLAPSPCLFCRFWPPLWSLVIVLVRYGVAVWLVAPPAAAAKINNITSALSQSNSLLWLSSHRQGRQPGPSPPLCRQGNARPHNPPVWAPCPHNRANYRGDGRTR